MLEKLGDSIRNAVNIGNGTVIRNSTISNSNIGNARNNPTHAKVV